ncbi:MAG: hypothetical protein J5793_05575 [Clostridia bacterium]|nr:hypothetical protein [Clostridia bacterium]
MKILIVSANALSHGNSNGRTLLNLLAGVEDKELYQIYTSGEVCAERLCSDTLRVTNEDIVRSLRTLKGSFSTLGGGDESAVTGAKRIKNARNMLLRDIAWDCAFIERKAIVRWAKEKKPDVVLLQAGDSALLLTIAEAIGKKLCIPIVVYNTEDYRFKNYDYMSRNAKPGIAYRIFHARFKRRFKGLMKKCACCVYNCEGLKKLYDGEYGTESTVIYPSTDMEAVDAVNAEKPWRVTYAGNLGVGRHRSLIKIGEALQEIGPDLYLDVYGRCPDDAVKDELQNARGIRYKGVVDYSEVRRIISESRLLIHAESFEDYFKTDARYAFSTKIPDLCASGVPFLVFAPDSCEAVRYVKEHSAAFCATCENGIRDVLESALYDEKARRSFASAALALAKENHDTVKNGKAMRRVLEKSTDGRRNS